MTTHPSRVAYPFMGVAALSLMLSLTACSSSGTEYIRVEDDQLMTLSIDGQSVTHEVLDCAGEVDTARTSSGSLDSGRSSIVWTTSNGSWDSSEGTFDKQDDVTVTESAVLFTSRLADLMYVASDSDEGKRERDAYDQACG